MLNRCSVVGVSVRDVQIQFDCKGWLQSVSGTESPAWSTRALVHNWGNSAIISPINWRVVSRSEISWREVSWCAILIQLVHLDLKESVLVDIDAASSGGSLGLKHVSQVINGHREGDLFAASVVLLDHQIVASELFKSGWHLGLWGVTLAIDSYKFHKFLF